MELRVVDTNFANTKDWVFKFENEENEIVYAMDDPFYKNYGLKSPINKQHSDTYEVGMVIGADVENFAGKMAVTKITEFLIR
jgi:hypothetical protein